MAVDAARAKSLFLAASDLADPAERAAYLDRECGGDAELRARVEALLRANDAAPLPVAGAASVDSAAGQPETEDYGDPTARVGAVLAGKYKLVEEIGAGRHGQRLHGPADRAGQTGGGGQGHQGGDGLAGRCSPASRRSGKPWR